MLRLRVYHALLATLVILAYLSGEGGMLHIWVGYGVVGLIAFRVLLAISGTPQLGLTRFYPQFDGLNRGALATHPAISRTLLLAIAACTIATAGTGIAMDLGYRLAPGARPAAVSLAGPRPQPDGRREIDDEDLGRAEGGEREAGPIGEAHGMLAKLLVSLVAIHVTYLLVFKRPLARFMLFVPPAKRPPDRRA
ncbi:MAG: cytochrome b/b6 domain-containing protein [Caulobacteraceae bacterium]|nr:cytochrome b/b6 domain-containing protein [Caulobacteraceae bacterium]